MYSSFYTSFFLLFFVLYFTYCQSTNLLQCKDENNRPVDWYVLYKIPRIKESSNPLIRKGTAYLYITNNTITSGWKLSSKDIGANDSIPGYTLSSLYNDKTSEEKAWVLYNDSPPYKQWSARYGHTKGVMVGERDQGFWLIHSVPNYPPTPNKGEEIHRKFKNSTNESININLNINDKHREPNVPNGTYGYPFTGRNNGQSFLCISLGKDQFDTVGRQLMYNQIVVYKKNVPASFGQMHPVFANATKQIRIKTAPYMNKVKIHSLGSMEFISFAKSDKWQKDLYDDFVGPQLQSDLLVETWLNGPGRLPSDCNGTKVMNIESIVLNTANVDFKSSHDHSKWAVAAKNSTNKNWICVGDINRSDTQYNRGGGTVCFNSRTVWNNYHSVVNDIEPCPRRRGNFIGN